MRGVYTPINLEDISNPLEAMSSSHKLNGEKPANQTKTIDDLFGLSDEPNDDPFNELGHDEPVVEVDDAPDAPEQEESVKALQVDMEGEDSQDPFAGIGEPAAEEAEPLQPEEPTPVDAAEPEQEVESAEVSQMEVTEPEEADPFAGIGEAVEEQEPVTETAEESSVEAASEVDAAELARQKYYADLLAEFEDDVVPSPGAAAPEVTAASENSRELDLPPSAPTQSSQLPPPVQALFGEDDSTFDDFLGGGADEAPTTPLPGSAPDLSIENSPTPQHPGDTSVQSLFSNASDWLDDTTMDESYAGQEGEGSNAAGPFLPSRQSQSTVEEDVEVPEGWIDEYGNFAYYTPEDKEAVRQTLLAERAASRATAPAVDVPQPTGYSENAARRTPQPDHPSQSTLPAVQHPYAPPVFSRHSTGIPTPQPAANVNAYTPAPVTSAYTPAQPAQTSYFPPTQSQPAPYDPYAPQSIAYTPLSQPTPPSTQRGPSQTAPVPPKPQRVVSNAYDPPFLRPQKSFIRPVTAAPAFPPPMPVRGTPPAPAPAPLPPSGPPRRAPSVPPASSLGLSRLNPPIPETPSYEPQSSYEPNYSSAPATSNRAAPPSRPSSQASQRKQPIPNAFDPPLRPPSVSRAVSRSTFEPPPPVPPMSLPLAPPPQGPSRPSSRGGQKRGTPMFEAPPPLPIKRPTAEVEDRYRQPGMPPPRAITPEQIPVETVRPSGVPRDAGWPHLTGSAEDDDSAPATPGFGPEAEASRFGKPVEEEDDPEGGRWVDDEDVGSASRQMDFGEEDGYSARPIHSTQQATQPSSFAPPPQQQPRQPPPPIARQQSYDPYAPSASGSAPAPVQDAYAPTHRNPISPPTPTQEYSPISHITSPPKPRPPIPAFSAPSSDPYAPSSSKPTEGAYQPYQPAAISIPVQPPTPYMPSSDPYAPSGAGPSTSSLYAPNRSVSPAQNSYSNLYAPGRSISPAQSSHLSASPQDNNYFQSMHIDTSYVPQQVLEQRPVSEDPLGRCTVSAKNAPLAIFGFGGVLVTAFPGSAEELAAVGHNRTPSYGYASGRGQLLIRPLASVMEMGNGQSDSIPFPGPLLLDPSHPKGSAGDKKKKEGVLAYLDARADEIERALPYLKSSASGSRREEEGKLLLIRLLSALVIGDGKFSGSPKVEEAMKKALASPSESHALITPGTLNSPAYPSSTSGSSKPLSAPGQLSTLSTLLVIGDKSEAVEYAVSHGLWSHALVIASSLGPEVWKDTMTRFTKEELAGEGVAGLKASYALFAGSDASIGELFKATTLIVVDDLFTAANITTDPAKDQWREVIASVVFNGRPAGLACLDDLAGKFSQRGLLNVAHACSLLSPTSPFVDPAPTAFDRPISLVQSTRNADAILFAEIAEYARAAIPVPKGLEVPFPGLPGLLPYKLQRAWQAAEQGDVDLAKRYCHAVESTSKLAKTGPALLLPHYISSLEDLLERLTGSPSIEPAKGLSARKQTTKPGLDKLGSWIGGRITTFIAGDDDSSSTATAPKVTPAAKGTAPAGVVGPFSHFSTISPAPSTDVSRNGSVNDFANGNGNGNGNGYLCVGAKSVGMPSPQNEVPPPLARGVYSVWGSEPASAVADEGNDDTPLADDEVGELLTPMAAMTFGDTSTSSYAPKKVDREEEDDEDDLGFGNAGLSRDRTPRPADNGDTKSSAAPNKKVTDTKSDEGSLSKDDGAKPAGWFKGWWGKKEGDAAGPGPIRAKLGDDNAMVFDKDLKRWVVKGQKPDAAPAAPPPPPRSQTVSPGRSSRPPSGTGPPTSQFGTTPRSVSGSAFTANTRTGPPQPRSGLAESVTAEQAPPAAAALSAPKPSAPGNGAPPPPGPGGMGRPPGGPPGMPKPPQGASIDDLLSRPPSKRPASAASRKGAKNRYVDVFQQPAEK